MAHRVHDPEWESAGRPTRATRSLPELVRAGGRRAATWCSRLADGPFDRRFGLSTRSIVPVGDMHDVRSPDRANGVRYEPTPVLPFYQALRRAGIPPEGTFVDVGCGKGRAMCMAARYGFRSVVGIDYSPRLCAAARANVESFEARSRSGTGFCVVEANAAEYEFPAQTRVVYLFNPFSTPVVNRLADRIERAARTAGDRITVVYLYPEAAGVFGSRNAFVPTASFRWGKWDFRVYSVG